MTQQGQYQQPPPQYQQAPPYPQHPPPMYPATRFHTHADIVHRFVAYLVDSILLGIIYVIIIVIFIFVIIAEDGDFDMFDSFGLGFGSLWAIGLAGLMFLIGLLYFSFMEGGANNATIGKRLMNIRVVDTNYQPIDLSKALVRNICRLSFLPGISTVILIIDFILILVREDKQRIGDIVANTYVIRDQPMGPQPYYPPPPQQYYPQQLPPQQQPPPPPPPQGQP